MRVRLTDFYPRSLLRRKLEFFLEEDVGFGDFYTDPFVDRRVEGRILSKDEGLLCGVDVAAEVFFLVDEECEVERLKEDGDEVQRGDLVLRVRGTGRLLTGEKVALNLLGRMSGVATHTRALVRRHKTMILDTRKTTPGLRLFEKYAVLVGGGRNHRFTLSHSLMLKENHLAVGGGVEECVEAVEEVAPFYSVVEVEAKSPEVFREALKHADVVMLDNFGERARVLLEREREEVERRGALVEVSGGVDLSSPPMDWADAVSTSAMITKSRWLDFSMEFVPLKEGGS